MYKKIIMFVIMLIFPVIIANADEEIKCHSDKVFDISSCSDYCNFTCTGITTDTVSFTHNNTDYSKYFNMRDNKKTIEIVDKSISFDPSYEYGIVQIISGSKIGTIKIKNKAYVQPTKETTTTKDPTIKEITVTLDPNNGEAVTTKTCKIVSGSDTCSITLPKLDNVDFNGWGTAKACKLGNSGSIRVDKDITYYACYETNTTTKTTTTNLYLDSVEILDKETEKKIEYGTFSRKKNKYTFKVLYNVQSLIVNPKAKDDIKVEVTGNEELKVGENDVVIKLTKDEETAEYLFVVTRLKEGETINNIHYLKNIIIGGYESQIKFNKDTFNYNLTIAKDVSDLLITAKPENETDKVKIENNKNLVNGSVIKISVTGDDDKTTTYFIKITKEETDLMLYIIIGIIVILLIIIILIVLIVKNKNKKEKSVAPKPDTNEKKDIEILEI